MKEKKVIDYTRTYRRIEADKKKCILYIVILILLGFLLMWTQIDDLTRMICKICAGVLKKYEPHMYVGIRSETYPLFGKISYLSAETVYPGVVNAEQDEKIADRLNGLVVMHQVAKDIFQKR